MPRQTRVKPRKIPKQKRSRETVEAILDAAAHILGDKGYQGLSTNNVAEKAGVSIGSLYQFFPNKDAIVIAIVERLYESDKELIERNLKKHKAEDLESVSLVLIESLAQAFESKRKLRKEIVRHVPRSGGLRKIDETRGYVSGLLKTYLVDMGYYSDGPLLKTRVAVVVEAIEAVLYSNVLQLGSSEQIREIQRMAVQYLKP